MRSGVLLLAALLAAGSGLTTMAAGSGNATNDKLLALPPDQQAAMLTKGIKGCAGEAPFLMGVTATGKAKGYAYWSVRCKDGRNYAVQISPDAKAIMEDCKALEGTGKECFKKF